MEPLKLIHVYVVCTTIAKKKKNIIRNQNCKTVNVYVVFMKYKFINKRTTTPKQNAVVQIEVKKKN